MSKIGIENLGEHLLSDVADVIKEADRAVHAALERQHLSHWRPASTAPYNQDLELRVVEDGATSALPFLCRHTNADEWINVDLGVPLQIRPVEWRAWLHGKSPRPYQSSILGPEGSALHRREQWGGLREDTNSNQGSFGSKFEM
jgi:hypothetical protein